MTDEREDRKPLTAWQLLKPEFDWLGYLVSWKAIIAGLIIAGIAVALFIVAGGVNIGADQPDSWAARNLLHFVFKRSVGSRATSVIPPDDLTSPNRIKLGAQHFDMVCANCHGSPGQGQSVVALSMSPRPQYLPKVVQQFTASELYLIVQHGVKYSAMPSWPTSQRPDEVWSMVAFVQQLPKMDGQTYRQMTALPDKAPGAPTASADGATLRPANPERNTPPVDEFEYAAPAGGFADSTVHANPTATCARCHGADGTGSVTGGEVPNLTIQDESYLRASLAAYTSGARKSGFMQNIAAQLSATQVAALADYYAGLAVGTVASPPADASLVQRGEKIATQGIRERAIPACANCHESSGATITGAPHIAGQSATFLRRQLGAFQVGGRGSVVAWNPMSAVAHDLDTNDMAALAAYYSGLKPVKSSGTDQSQLPHAMVPTGDLGKAKEIFEARCVKCHAGDGRGDPDGGFPNLTLQTAPYVAQTLYSFRSRARSNDKMIEVTDSLNFDELTSLADYVNGLSPQRTAQKPDADAAARGATIAMQGAPERGVPACMSCHGAKGVAALPLIPRLQGQSPAYMQRRLENFVKLYDVDRSTLNPMPAIANKLTAREREDLAAYFAAAEPIGKTAAKP